ncbi:MAG: tetratricopeptide repeat-containing sensor histidine kinase, partial [Bacteroidota bacterium]
MKNLIWLLFFLIVPRFCLGQSKADSLRNLIAHSKAKGDSENAAYNLSYLGYFFFTEKQYDSALLYYYQFLHDRPQDSKVLWLGSALNGIGACYSQTGLPDSAVSYYSQALDIFEQIRDTIQAIEVETNLAIIYKDIGLYDKALESSFDVLSKLENGHPGRALASCYSTIAFSYEKTGDLKGALEYHRKALEIRQKIAYRKGEALSYNNIGETFKALGLYDSALTNLEISLRIKDELGDTKGSASTLNNIGDLHFDRGDIGLAERYFVESLKLKRETNDRLGQVVTLNNLGRLKLKQNFLSDADRYLSAAEKLARETVSLELLRENLELAIELHKAKGNVERALGLAEELFLVKDSLLDAEKARSMRSLSIRYETEKKEQRIALLEQKDKVSNAKIEVKQTQVKALIVGLVMILLLALLALQYARMVKTNKKNVEFLLRELHHRVKNNLQILSSVLSLQSHKLTNEHAIQAIRSTEGRINAMALIHKKLYNEEQNRNINIKEYITELIEYLVYTYGYHERDLKLSLKIEEIQVDVDKAIPLGLVLNELIS